ncbi:MAG: PIN domain-containing protein [Candidatus Jacksonbacteria bacterium]
MVILDTNIIIDHLRQIGAKETAFIKIAQEITRENLAVSVITIQELYEGISTRNAKTEAYLLDIASPLKIYPYTYEIAQLAGEIARDFARPIEFADAAIAATAIVNGAILATLNRRHFVGVKNLELFNI